ncbi:MAG TPA: IS1595 family transposase [Methylophilaceae bacterium]|jgi:transposase-like protein
MAAIFQQTKAYRDLDIFDIMDLTDDEALELIKRMRWGDGDEVTCPDCQTKAKHYFIRTRKQWTCKCCNHRFSVTSSTPFSNHKLPLRKILALLYFFISSPQGQSANSFHAQFGTTLKTTFHNLSKVREVLFETMDFSPMSGLVHIDCAHFCGKPRRANKRKKTDSFVINNKLRNRKDGIVPDKSTHPESWNTEKLKKRRIVLAISQVDVSIPSAPFSPPIVGSNRTITIILKAEKAATILPIIKKYVSKNAFIMTDSGSAFQPLFRELGINHSMVNHTQEYKKADGTNNNMAESFFSRMRRAEFGTYNGMRPQYFAFYAAEFSWRNDTRHMTLQEKFDDVLKRIFTRETSKAFCNYNHGHRLGFEYVTH